MTDTRLLQLAFRANGSFSIFSGAAAALLAEPLAALMGLSSGLPLLVIGVALIPFGAWLLWLSRRELLHPRIGVHVSFLDAQWVLGTAILLIGFPELLNPTGQLLAIAIAIVVTGFASWQFYAARLRVASA